MANYKKHWYTLVIILGVTFGILGYYGVEVYRKAPPIPAEVSTASGQLLMTEESILNGQTAWQSIGGMQVGSIWGHGAYQAPDWTADWLHRELLHWLDITAKEKYGQSYADLDEREQKVLQIDLQQEYRYNRYDEDTKKLVVSDKRAEAMRLTGEHYFKLFGNDPAYQELRENYAMMNNTLPSEKRREEMNHFFYWTAWAAVTNRPDLDVTYTNNWPYEPLVDNRPTAENIGWSFFSIILLMGGIGGLVWGWSFLRKEEEDPQPAAQDPLIQVALTPSQKALGKYLLVVVALFTLQVFLGGLVAHYTIEGQGFYGINISNILPYSLARTWHLQAAMFWIATAFLAGGLFLVPALNGGKDPKFQKLGVDVLFYALVLVAAGTFIGNWLAIMQILPPSVSFWFGHQGYEYLDLGRFWQLLKFVGILVWLVLMLRGLVPAIKRQTDKNILVMFTASIVAVGLFYGAGLMYGERTHITVMEYWRWWVVHLWVEGFFEVFATVSMSVIFFNLGLVTRATATAASIAAGSLFLVGGIPGTFHHLYFAGTTTPVMAVGATFSALEVVPLILLGYEGWSNYRLRNAAPWMDKLKWPLLFFVAVAFWNMLGAGVFGFMINPPLASYYAQGLNTTPTHAHAALFGVYGFLALGFVLMILRYIRPNLEFNEKLMSVAFWWLNIGLGLMIFTSLLPIGMIQFYASITEGFWYARSETFMQQDIMQTLRWIRTIGDVVFIVGAVAVSWQVYKGLGYSVSSIRSIRKPTKEG